MTLSPSRQHLPSCPYFESKLSAFLSEHIGEILVGIGFMLLMSLIGWASWHDHRDRAKRRSALEETSNTEEVFEFLNAYYPDRGTDPYSANDELLKMANDRILSFEDVSIIVKQEYTNTDRFWFLFPLLSVSLPIKETLVDLVIDLHLHNVDIDVTIHGEGLGVHYSRGYMRTGSILKGILSLSTTSTSCLETLTIDETLEPPYKVSTHRESNIAFETNFKTLVYPKWPAVAERWRDRCLPEINQ